MDSMDPDPYVKIVFYATMSKHLKQVIISVRLQKLECPVPRIRIRKDPVYLGTSDPDPISPWRSDPDPAQHAPLPRRY